MKIKMIATFVDNTTKEWVKEHTGTEFELLQMQLQKDGCTTRLGTRNGIWHPFHAIKSLSWEIL